MAARGWRSPVCMNETEPAGSKRARGSRTREKGCGLGAVRSLRGWMCDPASGDGGVSGQARLATHVQQGEGPGRRTGTPAEAAPTDGVRWTSCVWIVLTCRDARLVCSGNHGGNRLFRFTRRRLRPSNVGGRSARTRATPHNARHTPEARGGTDS